MKYISIVFISILISLFIASTGFSVNGNFENNGTIQGTDGGGGVKLDLSPNVEIGYFTNSTDFAIITHNTQTDTENGNIYAMGADHVGYYQASKSKASFAVPSSASAKTEWGGTNSTWVDM